MPELQLSDAIEDDVSDPIVNPKSARELAMEKIAGENMGRVRATGDFDGLDEDVDPEDPDADQLTLQTQEPVVAAPASKTHTVKVDGEERTVTDDELVRAYQKNAAADRRLEEAAATLREANRRIALADEHMQAQSQQVLTQAAEADVQAGVKDVLSKMYGGDEDGAAAALTGLLMKSRGGDQPTSAPTIDVDQLTLQIQENMAIDSAFNSVKTDYPELISNPDLEELTASKVSKAIANGTPRAQAILDSAAEVYKLIGKEPVGRQQEVKRTSTSRMDNKARLDLVKPASGVASHKSVDSEESASDIIAEIAARRLGQTMPRRA